MLSAALIRHCTKCFTLKNSLHTSTFNLGSALYITGQKASETYAVLTPHIDCDSKFKDISKLNENITARGLDIDIDKLKKSWDFLKSVKEQKYQLESKREETSSKIKSLIKENTEKSESEIKTLKILGKLLRDNLKVISKEIWDLEETVMIRILSLPNDLHPDTPVSEAHVISTTGSAPNTKVSLSHLEIGQNMQVLKFIAPMNYYLENSAAQFETSLLQYSADFLNKKDFIQTSNCDFTKSVIVEGCGENHTDPNDVFILQSSDITNEDASLHLVGGASLSSFCALFTKHETALTEEPLKLFSLGRHYSPPLKTDFPGLLNVAQESSIQLFISTLNCEQKISHAFDQTLETIQELYKLLNLNFRLVKCCANELKIWESFKISIQMYSQHLQCYIEVGHLSMCGTYISKRLLMKYNRDGDEKDFLNVISGTVICVPKILACLLEDNTFCQVTSRVENILHAC